MDTILTYLAEHKTIIVGATATTLEVLTLVINFWRRQKADKKIQTMSSDLEITTVYDSGIQETKLRKFLWAANPLNLFRQL